MTAAEVTDLVSALVWPAIIAVLVLLFRNPIRELLARLRSVETPGFKGAFNEPAEKALGKAESIAVPKAHDQATQALINQTASQPWWAVHQAWRSVRWAAEKASPEPTGPDVTTVDRVYRLKDEDRVDDEVVQLAMTLRGLFYDMRREPETLTPTAAADFVEAASTLAQALRAIPSDSAQHAWPRYGPDSRYRYAPLLPDGPDSGYRYGPVSED